MIFTIAAITTLTALGVGAATVAAIFAVVRLIERLDAEGRERDPGDEDDGGGGGGPGPDGDPPWWPDFERELAAYVAGDTASGAARAGTRRSRWRSGAGSGRPARHAARAARR